MLGCEKFERRNDILLCKFLISLRFCESGFDLVFQAHLHVLDLTQVLRQFLFDDLYVKSENFELFLLPVPHFDLQVGFRV